MVLKAKPPKTPDLTSPIPTPGFGQQMNAAGQVTTPSPLPVPQAPGGSATTLSATGQVGQTATAPLFTQEGQQAFSQWAASRPPTIIGSTPSQQELQAQFARQNPQFTSTGAYQQQLNQTNATNAAAGGQQSLAAQGSQVGQQAAIDALNQIRGYTSQGLTDAEQGYLNSAIQRGTAQSQAAIRSLAQQAAARGAMDSGGMWAAQGAAAQGGANNAAALGAEAGMNAQQRALGATQGLYSMGQGIDAAAQGRGGSQDAMNLSLLQLLLGNRQQDFQNRLTRYELNQENSPWARFGELFGMGTQAANAFRPGGGSGGGR